MTLRKEVFHNLYAPLLENKRTLTSYVTPPAVQDSYSCVDHGIAKECAALERILKGFLHHDLVLLGQRVE